jgi:hypothetical protein
VTETAPPPQLYETTLYDQGGNGDAGFLVVPRRSFAEPGLLDAPDDLAEELGVDGFRTLDEATSAWPAVAVVLAGSNDLVRELLVSKDESDWVLALNAVLPSARRGFASYCVTANVIPFEQSPLSAVSLVGLLSRGTGGAVAAGGGIGFLISGPTPLALVTVPAGMIIFGSAFGLARGLQRGLEQGVAGGLGAGLDHKIRALLGVPPTDDPPQIEPPQPANDR